LEEPREDNPKLLKSDHVSLVAATEPALPDAEKKQKGCCYSLTGITSGEVMKRAFGLKRKTCGIFAKDRPEWLTVEGAFHLDLEWVCVSEATFVANLVRIYPSTTFIMWKSDMVLPTVNFVFCSQWLPPLSNKIWHCEVVEVLLASAEKFRFTKAWGWKSVVISIKHADVGGCSNTTRIIRAFVRNTSCLVDLKVQKRGPKMVSSFCKDHHFGVAVPTVVSRRMLTPQVHSEVTGIYHGDGLYPAGLETHSQFLLRSCRTSTGWCNRHLEPSEVLSLYVISDSVTLGMNSYLKSKVINIQHLTPVEILFSRFCGYYGGAGGGG
jgi:hypothetical protein